MMDMFHIQSVLDEDGESMIGQYLNRHRPNLVYVFNHIMVPYVFPKFSKVLL